VLVVDQATSSSDTERPSVSLLHRVSDAKFEFAPPLDFRVLMSGVCATGLGIRSGQWDSGSDQFVLSISQPVADSDNYRVWQIRARATEPGKPGRIISDNRYAGNNLVAYEEKAIRQNIEDQLNAVYNVLWRNLDKGAQDKLIQEERQWLNNREKLPAGFDQSFFTERRVADLVKRLLVFQGTVNHLDTDAAPSFVEFVPTNQGTQKWIIRLQWGNQADTWQPDNWQGTVSTDSALAVVYWRDAADGSHLAIGRLLHNTRYRLDQPSSDQMKAKVLAAILQTQNLPAVSCASSLLQPDHWEDTENVVVDGQAAGHTDKLASYQLNS
jgi:hypothetical protein